MRLTKVRMLLATVTALALMVGVGTAFAASGNGPTLKQQAAADRRPHVVRRGGRVEPGHDDREAQRRDQGRGDGPDQRRARRR